jgi:hypothetical protein
MVVKMASPGILAELFADINSCPYLFLREMSEPEENSLRLLIEEGIVSAEATPIEVAGVVIEGGHRITSTENARLFEIYWDQYIAYGVRNESYVIGGDDSERFELGNLARIYSKSNFLDYMRKATFASDEHPGPALHIEIICQSHIIDVLSIAVPSVKRLGPAHA